MLGLTDGLCGQTLDQFDDFKTPAGSKPKESFQKTEAFDGLARWSSEPLTQVRSDCGLFHLAPLTGTVMSFLSKRDDLARRSMQQG